MVRAFWASVADSLPTALDFPKCRRFRTKAVTIPNLSLAFRTSGAQIFPLACDPPVIIA